MLTGPSTCYVESGEGRKVENVDAVIRYLVSPISDCQVFSYPPSRGACS